ncbi:HD domain-containing protein [Alteromonas sp. 14N.309.X.WAT.G.H12]|uniref:HD domain-containing protein n=1 Tax=Alteromonas sp. 14N.309.X.WAT.G.H12 TaxID=3120824 RepID=UPI002FD25434
MDNQYLVPQRLIAALNMAAKAHAAQRRKFDQSPYFNHLIEVMSLLIKFGHDDEDLLISALLHDAIEDTNISYDELHQTFGNEVAETVLSLSDNKRFSLEERRLEQLAKAKNGSKNHRLIMLSDAINDASSIPASWTLESVKGSLEYLKKLGDVCGNVCPNLHQILMEKIDFALVAHDDENKCEISDKVNQFITQNRVFYCIINDEFYLSESARNFPKNVAKMDDGFDDYMRHIRTKRLSFYVDSIVFDSLKPSANMLGINSSEHPIELSMLRVKFREQ